MSENPSSIPTKLEGVSSTTAADQSDSRYQGYGGWLMVFCIVRFFIAPLFMLLYGIELITAVINVWNKDLNGQVGYLPFIVFIGNLVIVILGFVAAMALRKLRPGAVRFAKRYLIIRLAWSLGSLAFLCLNAGLPVESMRFVTGQVENGLFYSVVVFVIWYSYFSNSKRVKATFLDG
jgi:hypothetical protein